MRADTSTVHSREQRRANKLAYAAEEFRLAQGRLNLAALPTGSTADYLDAINEAKEARSKLQKVLDN